MRLAAERTEAENLFETLANKSPVGLYIVQDGKFCYTNPTFQSTTGYKEDELLGRDALELVVPEDKKRVRENAIKMLKGKLTSPYQFRVIHKNGSIKWIMESVASVQYRGRRATLGDFIDITERKQVEEKVQHLNLVLRAIRNVNQLIATGTDRDGLLKGTCDTLVEARGYYSAWIVLLDGSGKLVTAAEAGMGKSFLQVMERLKRGELTHCGYKALEKPGVLVIKDVSLECEDCPLAKEDSGRDAMSVRLEYSGKVYGLMTVSIPPGRAAEKEEQDLLKEIAGDIAFALYSMEQEQERKRMEEALQDSEEKLRKMFESVTDGISVIDLKGVITEANQRMVEMHGFSSKDELQGKSAFDLVAPRDHKRVTADIKKTIKQEAIRRAECTLLRADGSEFPGELSISVLKDASGNLVGHITIVRDITERKQAEEALRAERNKLQSLIDAMEDTITIQDTEYNITYQNEPSRRASGGDHLGEKCYRVYEGRETVCVGCPVEKAFMDGKSHTTERRTAISGKVAFWENTANPIRDAEGGIVSCLELARDITERKQAEEVLQAERNKLQSLIDAMEDNLTIQDRDYNLIYMPERVKKLWGAHTGDKCYRVFEGQEKTCDECPVEEAFKDGKSHTAERRTVLPSGEVAIWENRANPIRDAEGRIVACLEVSQNITKRKKTEKALQDSEEKLRKMFESITDGISVIDLKGIITELNQRTVEMHGFSSKDELRGKSAFELVAPRNHGKIATAVKKAIKQGAIRGVECTLLKADGSEFHGELSISVLKDSSDNLIGQITVARDITERKKQEQTLADEATRHRILFDQSLDWIVVLDVDARVVEANQRFAEMLGYTLEEVHKLHTWDWDKNFPRKKILEMGRNVDEKGLHLETRHTRKDGSVIDVDISISGIMYGGQKLIFCIGRDVTERKRAAEALKLAAEEWRNTFDSISDAISIHDRDFQILRANKAFADMYQVKPRQIIGKHCYKLHSGEKPISGCPHKQTLATGKPAMAEFYESHLGKYLLESTSPILNEKGEVVATVHVTRDITAQKQQSERLMMADRLASLGELAAGTAHELNNPLTSVLGFSQLVMEKDIPDDIREDLKIIYNEAQRAAGVTKNLLTFARKQAPLKQLTQINSIIEGVLKLRAYEQKANDIEVKRRLAHDLPEIMIDNFQMQQVFLNIIINAEYFMTEAHKKGTLTITTKKQNGTVRISIADDGPGISKENLSRIFDPFFTTKEPGKGTGLGLSICHGIVTEHGGHIYAKSQPGKGATIVVELPVNTP
jgi:PAS domain S-box-containing protein